MGLYFRKRLGIGPLALNFSKSGVGISTGMRGLRAGLTSHRGVYTSAGLPGTGLRFVKYYRHHHGSNSSRVLLVMAIPGQVRTVRVEGVLDSEQRDQPEAALRPESVAQPQCLYWQ